MNVFREYPLIFLVDIKLMDVKLMPFVGAGFKPAPTVNGKNDACLGGFPWRVQVCNLNPWVYLVDYAL